MRIMPLVSSSNFSSKENNPTFGARQKKETNIQTNDIVRDLTLAIKEDREITEKINSNMTDPKKRTAFMSVLSELIIATALKITESLNSDVKQKSEIIETKKVRKKVKNSDGDTYETMLDPKENLEYTTHLIKHKGRQAEHEIDLIKTITKVSDRIKPDDDQISNLYELYNKFCGENYKGQLYSPENILLSNKEIAQNLNKDLQCCIDKNELSIIISKYNKYSKEADKRDSKISKIIKSYPNISDYYQDIVKQENNKKQTQLENLVRNIHESTIPKRIKEHIFESINTEYNDNIGDIISTYNYIKTDSPELEDKFLLLLENRLLSKDALKEWTESSYKTNLDFFECNSMMRVGLDQDSVKEIAKHKRNTKFKNISVIDKDKFKITPPFLYINKNFLLINNIFKILNSKQNYSPLVSNEPKEYTIKDIEEEIIKHIDSYPNLKEHLAVPEQKYLNQGKMANLLDLYYGDKGNQDLFTLHSYLRFIERVVIPSINENNNVDESKYCASVNKTYIAKMSELKKTIIETMKNPIEIRTYTIGNVKAPQFSIPMLNANNEDLIITLNDKCKIHTIY